MPQALLSSRQIKTSLLLLSSEIQLPRILKDFPFLLYNVVVYKLLNTKPGVCTDEASSMIVSADIISCQIRALFV